MSVNATQEDTELARKDYEEATESHLKHVRDLDVAMFGEGAAKRPLLIDIKAELLKRIEFYKLYEAWAAQQGFDKLMRKWRIK